MYNMNTEDGNLQVAAIVDQAREFVEPYGIDQAWNYVVTELSALSNRTGYTEAGTDRVRNAAYDRFI